MKIRKDMIFAVLTTFCMCALMFTVVPIRSGLPYDPWADIQPDTPDGKIDIKDVSAVARLFGTSGDSTKNVTIAGHANKLAYSVESVIVGAGLDFYSSYISVDGYSKMTVCLANYGSNMTCYIFCEHFNGTELFIVDQVSGVYSFSKTYDVPNQEIIIRYYNREAVAIPISIDVYLIP